MAVATPVLDIYSRATYDVFVFVFSGCQRSNIRNGGTCFIQARSGIFKFSSSFEVTSGSERQTADEVDGTLRKWSNNKST